MSQKADLLPVQVNKCATPAAVSAFAKALTGQNAENLISQPIAELVKPDYEIVPEMFERVALRQAKKVAIEDGPKSWTYEQLSHAARTVGELLVANRLQKSDIVVIPGPANFDLIAAALGSLEVGGIIMFLENRLPPARQQQMVEQAGAKFLLWSEEEGGAAFADRFSHLTTLNISHCTKVQPESVSQKQSKQVDFGQDTPAYVTFTSGSKGVPKCLIGTHSALSHFLSWQRTAFEVNQFDRVGQLTALSFDVILREIFLPLTSGATLCLLPRHLEISDRRVLSWLAKEKITIIHTVPALADCWVAKQIDNSDLGNLRLVFFAGEPLNHSLIERWRSVVGQSGRLINLYGPSETTLAKCFYEVPLTSVFEGVQPVGKPLPHTQIMIIKDGIVLGPEQQGEIVIRTPFATRSQGQSYACLGSEICYYTGDVGRYRNDGLIEILGRLDDQVKVNGQRLALAEVEAALRTHPAVERCVVRLKNHQANRKALVAYMVLSQTSVSPPNLRDYLLSILPAYMVPAVFVCVETLPLSANGKIDYAALAEIPIKVEAPHRKTTATYSVEEKILLDIWSRHLGLKDVGVDDDFFEQGGDSLLALGLVTDINSAFKVYLPIKSLYRHPTVSKMLGRIEILRKQGVIDSPTSWRYLRRLSPIYSTRSPIFLLAGSLGREAEYVIYSNFISNLPPYSSVYGLVAKGTDGKTSAHIDVRSMARDYIEEIRTVQESGPYFIVGSCIGAAIAFEIARQLESQGQTVALLALIDGRYTTRRRLVTSSLYKFVTSQYVRKFPEHFARRARILAKTLRKLRAIHWLAYLMRAVWILAEEIEATSHITNKDFVFTRRQRMQMGYPRALRRYRPGYYHGNIKLLLTRDYHKKSVLKEWQKVVTGKCEVESLPGNHWEVLVKYQDRIAMAIERCFKQAYDEVGNKDGGQ